MEYFQQCSIYKFNGKVPERIENGVKIVNTFTKDNVGTYKCVSFNIIGSSSPHELKLNLREILTTSPTTSIHGNGASVGTTGKKEC